MVARSQVLELEEKVRLLTGQRESLGQELSATTTQLEKEKAKVESMLRYQEVWPGPPLSCSRAALQPHHVLWERAELRPAPSHPGLKAGVEQRSHSRSSASVPTTSAWLWPSPPCPAPLLCPLSRCHSPFVLVGAATRRKSSAEWVQWQPRAGSPALYSPCRPSRGPCCSSSTAWTRSVRSCKPAWERPRRARPGWQSSWRRARSRAGNSYGHSRSGPAASAGLGGCQQRGSLGSSWRGGQLYHWGGRSHLLPHLLPTARVFPGGAGLWDLA